MKYIVIELQRLASGAVANLVTSHDSRLQAESKYHTILAAAAVSSIPAHSAIIVDEYGNLIDSKCFMHETVSEEN